MSEAKHSPLPWKLGEFNMIATPIEAKNRRVAAVIHEPHQSGDHRIPDPVGEANATFIVRACNAHDALVAACKLILEWMDGKGYGGDLYRTVRGALALARPEKGGER